MGEICVSCALTATISVTCDLQKPCSLSVFCNFQLFFFECYEYFLEGEGGKHAERDTARVQED